MIELTGYVIWIGRSIEVGCVTIPTRHRQILVHVVDVATITRNCLMCTRERESRCRVIECRWSPHRRGVAGLTVMVEIAEQMIRIRGLRKLSLVTLVAIRVVQLVVPIDVAGLTLRRRMRSSQRE
jgi:hypothetical protein